MVEVLIAPSHIVGGEAVAPMTGDILFDDAIVWSGAPPRPRRGCLLIRNGRVADFGSTLPPKVDRTIDLSGRQVLPGFVDAHSHLTVSAWLPHALDATAWRSADDATKAIARHRATRPAGAWLLAMGADFDQFRGRLPRPDDLQSAAGGSPVVVADFSLHRSLVSHTVLAKLSARGLLPATSGDVETSLGRPTGMLWEGAHAAALNLAMGGVAQDLGEHGHAALLDREASRHLSLGITACHDPCVPVSQHGLIEALRSRTPLRLSWSSVSGTGLLEPAGSADLCPSCGEGPASAKLFMDGAHRCALCLDPTHVLAMVGATARQAFRGNFAPLKELMAYRSVYREGKVYMPYLRMDAGELARRLETLAEHGVRPKVHAVGNHAAACCCQALERVGCTNATLEHLTFLGERDVESAARSGAVASLQPGFIDRFGAGILDRAMTPRLRAYPTASLKKAGVPIALSSDNPCGPLSPLNNIRKAVLRRSSSGRIVDGREALTLEDAVEAYTIGGYHAIHGLPGQGLSQGAPADVVIAEGDLLSDGCAVAETWINGERVW